MSTMRLLVQLVPSEVLYSCSYRLASIEREEKEYYETKFSWVSSDLLATYARNAAQKRAVSRRSAPWVGVARCALMAQI